MDSIRQIRQGNGLSRLDLGLQLGHRGLLADEVRQLLKAEAVAVMAGYHTIPFQHNDVADGHRRVLKIGGVVVVELIPELIQRRVRAGKCGQRGRVDQIIIVPFHGTAFGFQPVQGFKANIPQRIIVPDLIDGETVRRMVQKRFFALRLVLHPVQYRLPEVLAFLPFLAGDGEHHALRLLHEIVPVKDHSGIFARLHHINGQILFQQFRRPFSGEGQQIAA